MPKMKLDPIEEVTATGPEVVIAEVAVPMLTETTGYCGRDMRLSFTPDAAKKINRLMCGLARSGEVTLRGTPIANGEDAIRWLVNQLPEA